MNAKYRNAVDASISALLANPKAKQAVKYLSPTDVVKATRQHKSHHREKQITVLVTIGKPNFLGRRFIAQAKKAGEPFPIKKVQLKLAA